MTPRGGQNADYLRIHEAAQDEVVPERCVDCRLRWNATGIGLFHRIGQRPQQKGNGGQQDEKYPQVFYNPASDVLGVG